MYDVIVKYSILDQQIGKVNINVFRYYKKEFDVKWDHNETTPCFLTIIMLMLSPSYTTIASKLHFIKAP